MDESVNIEIRFRRESADILPAEVVLLESILPEIIHAMMAEELETD